MDAANNLIAWDYVSEFTRAEVACLIAGIDPAHEELSGQQSAHIQRIMERLDAASGSMVYIWLTLQLAAKAAQDAAAEQACTQTIARHYLFPVKPVKHNGRVLVSKGEAGTLYRMPDPAIDGRNAGQYTFSRYEIARWLRDNGLQSAYVFNRVQHEPAIVEPLSIKAEKLKQLDEASFLYHVQDAMFGADTEAYKWLYDCEATTQPPPAPDKPLSTRERTSLLLIIAALCKEAKINYSKPTTAAENILHQLDGMGASLSPRAIEEHLKKIPDALERRMK